MFISCAFYEFLGYSDTFLHTPQEDLHRSHIHIDVAYYDVMFNITPVTLHISDLVFLESFINKELHICNCGCRYIHPMAIFV